MAAFVLALLLASEPFSNGLAPVVTRAPVSSARACAACHRQVHEEWTGSRHGQAWTNAIFQREFKQQPLDWCVHCHAPLAEQLAEVHAGGGPLANEGVTCVACHVRDGKMLARERHDASPHDTVPDASFGGPQFCAGCHQFNFPLVADEGTSRAHVVGYSQHPMQDTVAQHDRGPRASTECLACHGTDASHRFPGGHDEQMRARAVAIEACRTPGTLTLTLANRGAGHHVPTGDLHRHLVLRAWMPGAPERLHETLLGRQFAPAPDGGKVTISDTSLRTGEVRQVRVPLGKLGPAAEHEPIRLELRLVFTIDEFPFRGRELAEPTSGTMLTREVVWKQLPRCGTDRTMARSSP